MYLYLYMCICCPPLACLARTDQGTQAHISLSRAVYLCTCICISVFVYLYSCICCSSLACLGRTDQGTQAHVRSSLKPCLRLRSRVFVYLYSYLCICICVFVVRPWRALAGLTRARRHTYGRLTLLRPVSPVASDGGGLGYCLLPPK